MWRSVDSRGKVVEGFRGRTGRSDELTRLEDALRGLLRSSTPL